jgi:hypothetical protein
LRLRLNKNLCHFPLARDARLRLRWRRLKGGSWFCDLSDDDRDPRIRFVLPRDADASLRRAPTGFDTCVLFALLAEVQLAKLARVKFGSGAEVLRRAGLCADTRGKRRLYDALAYWSVVKIWFQRWYVAREGHASLKLLPPIRSLKWRGRRLVVVLDGEWVRIALDRSYYARVPLELLSPAASEQNLVLWLLRDSDRYTTREVRTDAPVCARRLCRKLGITHRHRNQVLGNAVARINELFGAGGGAVFMSANNDELRAGKVRLLVRLPRLRAKRCSTSRGERRNGAQLHAKRCSTSRETVLNTGDTLRVRVTSPATREST